MKVIGLRLLALGFLLLSACGGEVRVDNEEQIVALVKRGDYEAAERALASVHQRLQKDPLTEDAEHRAFYVFYRPDPSLEKPLNDWVAVDRDSTYAFLARGIFRTKLGWSARGTRWASETSAKDFRTMGYWFKGAREDLEKAIALDASQGEAYLYLIEIEMNERGTRLREFYEAALALNPASLHARWYYTTALLPRWGGSHAQIDEVVKAAVPYEERNPRLRILRGRVEADLADAEYVAKNCDPAVQMYTLALRHGSFWYYNQKMGECLYELDDYPQSIEKLTHVIREKPGYEKAYRFRAYSYGMDGQYEAAIADINRVLEINGDDASAYANRGYINRNFDHLDKARADYAKAIELDPSNDAYRAKLKELQGR